MNIEKALNQASKILNKFNIKSSNLDSQVLLANVINENRDYIEYPLHGYYVCFEGSKYLKGTSPINHFEIIGKTEKHIELKDRLFLGSSFKAKWSSSGFQPYFSQKGFDYGRIFFQKERFAI